MAKGGNTSFFGLDITLPLFLLVLKQFALESAEQQCWRNSPSRKMQVRKKKVSVQLAATLWLGFITEMLVRYTGLALQAALSLALQIQSN